MLRNRPWQFLYSPMTLTAYSIQRGIQYQDIKHLSNKNNSNFNVNIVSLKEITILHFSTISIPSSFSFLLPCCKPIHGALTHSLTSRNIPKKACVSTVSMLISTDERKYVVLVFLDRVSSYMTMFQAPPTYWKILPFHYS